MRFSISEEKPITIRTDIRYYEYAEMIGHPDSYLFLMVVPMPGQKCELFVIVNPAEFTRQYDESLI